MKVDVVRDGGRVLLRSAYNPSLISVFTRHGCWWDKSAGAWVVRVPRNKNETTLEILERRAGVGPSVLHVRRIVRDLCDRGHTVVVEEESWIPAGHSGKFVQEDGGATRF
jgi:hypothetical protein